MSATGPILLATNGQFPRPPTGSHRCPLTTGMNCTLETPMRLQRKVTIRYLHPMSWGQLMDLSDQFRATCMPTNVFDLRVWVCQEFGVTDCVVSTFGLWTGGHRK